METETMGTVTVEDITNHLNNNQHITASHTKIME